MVRKVFKDYFYSRKEVFMIRAAETMFAWNEVWDVSRPETGVCVLILTPIRGA